ncbi:MAG: undecaprenyldiphospho-muramoylpentapeptide beta-N-acetylglucosaminyltransferase [Patescibacteria group bacterium]
MKIILSGGGTLGSVTPLLALVDQLKQDQSIDFLWLGTKAGPEHFLVEQAQLKFIAIPAGKWRRYFSLKNIFDILKVLTGLIKSLYLMYKLDPQVVVVAGGFVGVPVGWAAWAWGVPLIIHQQDVEIGLANRLLGWCAAKITTTWPVASGGFFPDKTKVIGTPLRKIFQQPVDKQQILSALGFNENLPVILVIGGGTGAEFLNKLIAQNLDGLKKVCQIIHITGINKSANHNSDKNYKTYELVTNKISEYLAVADLVLSRAGMGLISELAYFAKPSIIVPLPNTHQEKNAQYLHQHNAALVIEQSQLTGDKLINIVHRLNSDPESLIKLGINLKALFPQNSAGQLAEIVMRAAKKI